MLKLNLAHPEQIDSYAISKRDSISLATVFEWKDSLLTIGAALMCHALFFGYDLHSRMGASSAAEDMGKYVLVFTAGLLIFVMAWRGIHARYLWHRDDQYLRLVHRCMGLSWRSKALKIDELERAALSGVNSEDNWNYRLLFFDKRGRRRARFPATADFEKLRKVSKELCEVMNIPFSSGSAKTRLTYRKGQLPLFEPPSENVQNTLDNFQGYWWLVFVMCQIVCYLLFPLL